MRDANSDSKHNLPSETGTTENKTMTINVKAIAHQYVNLHPSERASAKGDQILETLHGLLPCKSWTFEAYEAMAIRYQREEAEAARQQAAADRRRAAELEAKHRRDDKKKASREYRSQHLMGVLKAAGVNIGDKIRLCTNMVSYRREAFGDAILIGVEEGRVLVQGREKAMPLSATDIHHSYRGV